MPKYEFEYFDNIGKLLFAPLTEAAGELCKAMRHKNLTVKEIEFYHSQGYEITLRPRATLSDNLKKLVRDDSVIG